MKNLKIASYVLVNGLYSLKRLKPIFINFPEVDISNIIRGTKEEAAATWGNTTVNAIGSIHTKSQNQKQFTNLGKCF